MAEKIIKWGMAAVVLLVLAMVVKSVILVNVMGDQKNCVNLGPNGVCQVNQDTQQSNAIGGDNPYVTVEQQGTMEQSGDLLDSLRGPLAIGGVVFAVILLVWLKAKFKVS